MIWQREPDDEPIPGYKLVEPLGVGGFGEVWKCVAPGGLHKAIKFVFGNMNSMDGDSAKCEQEFKALERIKLVRHPFVLSMDRIEIVGGELLIVMELADKSLHDCFQEHVLAGRPGIPRDVLIGYLADAAEGLDHLNEKNNVQHLDVKPKNLFLISDHVKVADFGLVKHLERQSSAGLMGGVTPVYASPETFANKISKQSDEYSLAVVYCELLSGQRPFNGKNIRQLALQHMTEEPDLSMLPEEDRKTVRKALAKNPEDRYPNCASFIEALKGKAAKAEAVAPWPRLKSLVNFQATTPPPVTTPPARPGLKSVNHDVTATVSRLELGILRPSLLIGVGSFGRRALHQIRSRLLDRVGDLQQVPSFRFLYLDVDPAAADKVAAMSTEAAIEPDQLLHLPLQPATAYRRKQIDQILEWLPREKLYAIPRSLAAEGSRALGRLAFCDHYLKVTTRLKNELQIATHPEAMKQSSDQTGLAIRDKRPSVYIFASASGGSGGMLLDLGHAIRRVVEKHNVANAPITAFLFCGCPDDVNAPNTEQANVYAALTELNHYADPDVTFTARYGGMEGPKAETNGLPFNATYIMPIAQRTSEAFRDCLSHLSGYITQELTTPLGSGLDDFRRKSPKENRTPFRGFGTFGVWYPRGLLLRSAARQLFLRLAKSWTASPAELPSTVDLLVQAAYNDPRLTPEAVQQFIASEAARGSDGPPLEALGKWLKSVGDQAETAARRSEGANWAIAVWDQAKDAVGVEPTTDADSPYRRGRFSRALDPGLHAAMTAWDNEIHELLRPLGEQPGPKLASIEAALHQLTDAFDAAARLLEEQLPALQQSRCEAQQAVQASVESCQGGSGSFTFFGSRAGRSLRGLTERLKRFVDMRCSEDLTVAAMVFYRRMSERLRERLQDMAQVREQLAKLIGFMETAAAQAAPSRAANANPIDAADETVNATLQMSNTVRVVLPNGDTQLDRAAAEMLELLQPEEYTRLQDVIQRLVLDPRGGLEAVCKSSPDLRRALAVPIVEQMTAYLTNLLPTQDIAQIELASPEAKAGELGKRIATYLKLANAQVGGPPDDERTFVLVPATAAGLQYSREVKGVVSNAITVMVQGGGTDLMFCREQGCLRTADMMRLIEPCQQAYEEQGEKPERSPHSRHDVSEWMPLVAR
jgi:serine/threonine protein kinase